MTEREQLIEKIRKLRAKSQDSSTTEQEAAAFAAKVRELMDAHSVEDHELLEKEETEFSTVVYEPKYSDPWRRMLLSAVCALYGCFVVRNTRQEVKNGRVVTKVSFEVSGIEYRIDIAREMFEYLCETTVRLAREYSPVRRTRLDFERGCGERLKERIREMRDDNQNSQTSGSTALAELSLRDKVKLYVAERYPSLKYSKPRSNLKGSGALAGMRAADNVHLGGRLGGGGGGKLLT